MPNGRGGSAWFARHQKDYGAGRSHKVGLAEIEGRIIVNHNGTNFEDCLRLAIMLDEADPRDHLDELLFDYRDSRWPSTKLKMIYRDKVLGLTAHSPYAVSH